MIDKETKNKILDAHKLCCPYNTDQFKQKQIYLGKPILCGAGEQECSNKCYYMKTFIRALRRITR